MIRLLAFALLLSSSLAVAQRKVAPKNPYNRLICVVPMVGSGKADDPRRPKYAPWPPTQPGIAPVRNAILAFSHQVSDDGTSALVEFIALDQSAFSAILSDKAIKAFHKGTDKKDDIEKELRKYKKDFDLDRFGLVMP